MTSYAYWPTGEIMQISDPEGHTTYFDYDSEGRPLSATDPLGRVTTQEHDARDRLTGLTESAWACVGGDNPDDVLDPIDASAVEELAEIVRLV